MKIIHFSTQERARPEGFTLIEVMVYLALFGLLIGGAVIAAYNVIESIGRNNTQATIQQEGNFLLAKINWTLSGISAVNQPLENTTSSQLLVAKTDLSIGAVDINIDPGTHTKMLITRSGLTSDLNNDNVDVSGLVFDHQHPIGGAEWVTSNFTLTAKTPNGQSISRDFTTTKYLRQ